MKYIYKKLLQILFVIYLYIIISFISKEKENKKNLNIIYRNIQKKFNYSFNNSLNKAIKLGIFTYSIKNGGRARVTSLLINYFCEIKIFKIYLFTKIEKEENEYFLPKNIKRIIINKNIDALIKEYKLDIIIYEFDDIDEVKAINELNNSKVIFYNHAAVFYWIYRDINYFKKLYFQYRKAKYLISLIPLEVNYLFPKWGINSILLESIVPCQYNNIFQSDLKQKIILMFGRGNDKFKRFNLGILAMEYISKAVINSNLFIITNSSHSSDLLNFASKFNLDKNIKFFDYISTPEIYFRNASLNFIPSISESFSLTLFETKIYGIPNILMGVDYTMISNEGSIIIYDDEPESLAKYSIELLSNHTRLKILSVEARKSLKRFQNINLINKWVKLILLIFNDIQINKTKSKDSENYEHILSRQLLLLNTRNKEIPLFNISQFLDFNYLHSNIGSNLHKDEFNYYYY